MVDISGLPDSPALCVFNRKKGNTRFVTYVGGVGHLRHRVTQHMNKRDSHKVMGVSAVSMNPECITGWTDESTPSSLLIVPRRRSNYLYSTSSTRSSETGPPVPEGERTPAGRLLQKGGHPAAEGHTIRV